MYVSYLVLRSLVADPERRAVTSAVFGVFAFLDVPIVYMSIRWWRTQHPQPVIGGGEGSGLDPVMWGVLVTAWGALLGLMVLLLRARYRLEVLRHEVEEMTWELDARQADREAASARAASRASI
jgi:heme exporter protein C